jgi:quinol monooxygenase YgiN
MKLTIELRSKPDKTQELHQALQALLPSIRREKGCRDCRVWRDVEDEEVFFLAVDWETRASLEQAMRSGSGGAFIGAVDLLSETARVRFGEGSPWEGIESLKRMRKKA